MKYIADLHIHSHYSRATSPQADVKGLYMWASLKGIKVVGTGDFTHPGWLEELENALQEAEQGLYVPKEAEKWDEELPLHARIRPRFVFSVEISSIYKKNGRVRKVHTVFLMPSLKTAREFHTVLDKLGNVRSDGRPILGIDPKELLKIALEIDPDAEVIPAHIWTPWFSVLGAKSGFDSIEEAFEELAGHIHALETGLSSDPSMNYMVSKLDRYTLVSNSDAHSPANLGREANVFDTELSYHAMVEAIRDPKKGFVGTVEMYPQEGKYHFDGHRKCNVVLTPDEAIRLKGICPVCSKPLTMGVMHRVTELADREFGFRPKDKPGEFHLIPLAEVIAEIKGVGPNTKRVRQEYDRWVAFAGGELELLMYVPVEEIRKQDLLLAEAIKRIREERVIKEPGFDGVYGQIRVFRPGEKDALLRRQDMFGFDIVLDEKKKVHEQEVDKKGENRPEYDKNVRIFELTPSQERAVNESGDVMVVAGPGTGKTAVLIKRIVRYIQDGIEPSRILAVTFTNRAAQEIYERLQDVEGGRQVRAMTLHALGLIIMRKVHPGHRLITEDEAILLLGQHMGMKKTAAKRFLKAVALYKATLGEPPEGYERYEELLQREGLYDMDDLIFKANQYLERGEYDFDMADVVLVDEIQDLTLSQAQMVINLRKKARELFLIGDPQQSIYGFRGAYPEVMEFFGQNLDGIKRIELEQTFRLTRQLEYFSAPLRKDGIRLGAQADGPVVQVHEFGTVKQEAIFVAKQLVKFIGGHAMHEQVYDPLSAGDCAIIARTKAVLEPFKEALEHEGLTYIQLEDSDQAVVNFVSGMVKGLVNNNAELEKLARELGILWIDEFVRVDRDVKAGVIQDAKDVVGVLENIAAGFERMGYNIERLIELRDAVVKKIEQDDIELKEALKMMDLILSYKKEDYGVSLLTMHAAKGLEFRVVFVVGAQQGLIPLMRFDKDVDIDEERRLFYVAVTRSKEYLYLSWARNRRLQGINIAKAPTQFLSEVYRDAYVRHSKERKRAKKMVQGELF